MTLYDQPLGHVSKKEKSPFSQEKTSGRTRVKKSQLFMWGRGEREDRRETGQIVEKAQV